MIGFNDIGLFVGTNHPYKLLFLSTGGLHAYGIATKQTDYDIRGIHMVSIHDCLVLNDPLNAIEYKFHDNHIYCTHEIKYFVRALLFGDITILEGLYSPLVEKYSSFYDDLQTIAKDCVSKSWARAYKTWAHNYQPKTTKPSISVPTNLLHRYRCILTARYLLRHKTLLLHLPSLAEEFNCKHAQTLSKQFLIDDQPFRNGDLAHHYEQVEILARRLDEEFDQSQLQERPTDQTYETLNNFLLELRLETEAYGSWLSAKYSKDDW